MTFVWNKILIFLLSCGFIWVIVYRCFGEILNFEGAVNDLDAKPAQQKRKYVAVLSRDKDIKMVYIDNENMDDIEALSQNPNSVTNSSVDVITATFLSSYYESSSVGTENPWGIEWDETIDYDYSEKHALNQTKRSMDPRNPSKNTVVLVQDYRHSNNPITNIMYRYGDSNKLSFALPKKSAFQDYWPLRFHPSFVDPSLTFSSHVNMLINPLYRYETIKRFMPKDTVFIVVLQDPVKSFFSQLMKHPLLRRYKRKKRLKIIKNLVARNKVFGEKYLNAMAFQFGYLKKHGNHNKTTKEIIDELNAQFDVVLMGDYLDESLVVLKNFLNWSLSDVGFTSRKGNIDFGDIPKKIRDAIKAHNKLDQAIYDYFNKTFWRKVEFYGSNFTVHLRELQKSKLELTSHCKREGHSRATMSTQGDTLCTRMKWGDMEYVSYLKKTSKERSNVELNSNLQYLKNSLLVFFNTTRKEIKRYLES